MCVRMLAQVRAREGRGVQEKGADMFLDRLNVICHVLNSMCVTVCALELQIPVIYSQFGRIISITGTLRLLFPGNPSIYLYGTLELVGNK